jgi:hypothetical protein
LCRVAELNRRARVARSLRPRTLIASSRDLGVVAGEVVDAADRWQAAEGGVGPVMVVPMDPGLQGPVAAALERYSRRYAHSSSRVRLNRSTLPLVCGR